ncbi:MAG: hypothetical protein AB1633_08840, partial [Elusimicrobiota bacterium]
MNRKFSKFSLILWGLFFSILLFSNVAYSHQIFVRNLIGKTTGALNTVPLPSKIKASSDYVPLFRIDITTNSGDASYVLKIVTVTLVNVVNFSSNTDLQPLISDGVTIFKDPQNGNYTFGIATTTWDGASSETKLTPDSITSVSLSSFSWSVRFAFSGANQPDAAVNSNKLYTFYICVKTADVSNGDQFHTDSNVSIDIAGSTFTITADAFPNMTADTISPAFQLAYSVNPTGGTSLTVANNDTYNIYSTTEVSNILPHQENNSISLRVTLGESNNSLSDTGIFSLYDLFTLDTSAIDGSNALNTKSISYNGSNEFTINYTLVSSTINQPSTPLPFRIKVRDAAGNESAYDESFYCYIDRTAPAEVT